MELKIDHLTKQYKDKKVLDDVSFTLTEGVYGLLGPNGAGKTTLVSIVVGILSQTGGSVSWNGEETDKLGAEFREIIGYLPQAPSFYRNFTCIEFLKYMAAVKGVPGGRKKHTVLAEKMLETVGLSESTNQKIGELSGGMRQRLGIAEALINDPKLLILDEPTSGLDPKERVRLRNVIAAAGLDRIVIWTTHIVSDVEYIASASILLNKGKLMAFSRTDQLTEGIRGKVFEVEVRPEDVPGWEENYLVSNLRKSGEGVILRVVGDFCPNGTTVEPTLEDVCLYYFQSSSQDMEL